MDREMKIQMGGAGILASFWTSLHKAVERKGGNVGNLHILGEDSNPKAVALIDGIADLVIDATKSTSKPLKLVTAGIPVAVNPFSKNSFFGQDGPAKLWFGENFRN